MMKLLASSWLSNFSEAGGLFSHSHLPVLAGRGAGRFNLLQIVNSNESVYE
jgi:hypothetical protein